MRLLKSFYWSWCALRDFILSPQEIEWSCHTVDYSAGRSHPHRPYFLDVIAKYHPSSILVIGCNCGCNLSLMAERWPHARIHGIDLCADAIEACKEIMAREGHKNVTCAVGNATALDKKARYDVVCTDATLLYIHPLSIRKVLADMSETARKAVVLMEQHKRGRTIYLKGHWVRDYAKAAPKRKTVTLTKIPPEIWPVTGWMKYGYVVEIR